MTDLAGIALVPVPVEVLGHGAELDDQVAGEVLRLDLAALLPPEPEQGGFIVAHDDPGVRAADEAAAVRVRFWSNPQLSCHVLLITRFGRLPIWGNLTHLASLQDGQASSFYRSNQSRTCTVTVECRRSCEGIFIGREYDPSRRSCGEWYFSDNRE